MTGVRVNIFKCASVYLCIYLCTKIPPSNKHIPDETWGMNKSKTKRIIQLWCTLETSLVLGEGIQVTKRNDIDCKKSLAYKQITEKSTLRFSDFVPSFFFFLGYFGRPSELFLTFCTIPESNQNYPGKHVMT